MDKDRIQSIADAIAQEDYGQEFYDLSPKLQIKVYEIAIDRLNDMMADQADMMRKNEKYGGLIDKPLGPGGKKKKGKKYWLNMQQVNTQEQYLIDQVWSFHTKKWLENGMVPLFMYLNLNLNNHN